ncbi:MAG TPA: 50S ribosomal protein L23 [Spirochaetota bacterium]|nr:50S ribosomal protein L23 [Spirochaetota bacterium]HPJ36859.1 50S ribosomal protein L23 [Spirochaetota bacterium]HPQ51796.1 50S ribosomal protein L23 [Spirochaetota bacterium]
MDVNEVIIRPVLSEKSTEMTEIGKYVFRVSMKANKIMIKKAVKEIFDVEAEQVNVIRVRGRKKRVRYKYGYTSSWKKAIVTLKKGQKIELFEGQ